MDHHRTEVYLVHKALNSRISPTSQLATQSGSNLRKPGLVQCFLKNEVHCWNSVWLVTFEKLLQFLFVAGEVEDRPHILGGWSREGESQTSSGSFESSSSSEGFAWSMWESCRSTFRSCWPQGTSSVWNAFANCSTAALGSSWILKPYVVAGGLEAWTSPGPLSLLQRDGRDHSRQESLSPGALHDSGVDQALWGVSVSIN